MPKAHNPRHGSMQYWPRKRAKKPIPRVRSHAESKEAKVLEFAGYKAGMTHIAYIDENKNSITKNMEISSPVTIIECPPLVVLGIRFYAETDEGLQVVKEIVSNPNHKDLKKRIRVPKKKPDIKGQDLPEYDFLRLTVFTQPRLAGFGKKKPDIFEVSVGGKKEDQLSFAKNILGKEIKVSDVFNENDLIDTHGVTKGKGFQGPVKRFGITIQRPKKEKAKRNPGARSGGWVAQGHMMFRVATAGQTGFHLRTEFNKQVIKISDNPKEINPKGGLIRYGLVKTTFLLVKGSVQGPKKRLIRLSPASRSSRPANAISPTYISLESKQR